MLCCLNIYKPLERICSEPHYQFSTLHPIQQTSRESCPNHKESLPQSMKDEGTNIHKCLMIYHNTPLTSTSKSPMQMLQQRSARSQLWMSNAARRQLGIAVEQPSSNKNQHLPSHNFHIRQEVMCQNPITRRWSPATIKALCPEPRSYQIETLEGVTYRRTQNHLKPYQSHQETPRREQSN